MYPITDKLTFCSFSFAAVPLPAKLVAAAPASFVLPVLLLLKAKELQAKVAKQATSRHQPLE
jgi:hypothetical protein